MATPSAQAAAILSQARTLVVLTGAGVSQESGIPTFRDALTGLWARYDPEQLATPQAFRLDPKLVWDWYRFRRELVSGATFNRGHLALAQLEKIIPRVVVVTQNIDGLHQAAGSSEVVELHGSLSRNKCFANCRGNPTLIDVSTLPDRDASPPRCPHCSDFVRPDVGWFGEALPEEALGRAYRASAGCDVMLVVGTSGAVYPAAVLPRVAIEGGGAVIEVNPERSAISPFADLTLLGPAGSILPELVSLL